VPYEGHLIPTGTPGIYGRSALFEDLRHRVAALVAETAAAADGPERVAFPPVLGRSELERIGYLKSFPHLAGTIFSFAGDEADAAEQERRAEHHEDWSEFQQMTDLVLVPAACYPVYPVVAARGPLPAGGVAVDAGSGYVFRREPSDDPMRMQMFHQRELVRIGEPETVVAWRDAWRDRGLDLLRGLGLDVDADLASDPFFGRGGRMLAADQRERALKFELLVRLPGRQPTAIASFNYHEMHFASVFGLELANGDAAHSACLGFGEERIVLSLLHTHGADLERWPAGVLERLRLEG
jgi:seryl-tRNA synthetase